MRTHAIALITVLNAAVNFEYANAFTPVTLSTPPTSLVSSYPVKSASEFSLNMSNFIGMDDEDDDDDEDEDEDEYIESSVEVGATSPFTGLKLDPFDPKPLMKPRPSKYFPEEYENKTPAVPDDELVQTMSAEERAENLKVMRQISKNDLPLLQDKRDHAGYMEANQDLKRRIAKDPWFGVNERLKEAIQFGKSEEEIQKLRDLMEKLDGPPGDVEIGWRGYAEQIDIYKYEMSAVAKAMRLENAIRKDRSAQGRARMEERKRNEEKEKEQYEEDMRFPGLRREREAKARREAFLERIGGILEEDRKKTEERAKEILGKLPETEDDMIRSSIDQARADLLKLRKQRGGSAAVEGDEAAASAASGKKGSSAQKAREAAAAEASGGRPRLPGDKDVTRGELGDMELESSSSTDTGPLTVEVSSVYNKEQSDPPMRKHCFQYTIRITNNSSTDTIQLLGRRFEIQTVGSSMKDVVQGEGVTGRQPILKPGEVFEYTSTAPLSVRPIGTTIIAARMRGEYRYVTLAPEQETATDDQVKSGGDASAELGTFHFIFPEDQRVIPFKRTEDEVDEDDDEEDDDDDSVAGKKPEASKPSSAAKPKSPASSLPGDDDMKNGDIDGKLDDSSDTTNENVRVQVSSSYRPERSDSALDKHCFAYNIRITNDSKQSIQLVSRRFEIQTIGSPNKDVVQGPGVTGRQPILKPGESFEYTSTAPLSVKPMEKTPVVARMQGEYNFVQLAEDGSTPLSSTPLQAKLGVFHFVLPSLEGV